MHNLFVQEPVEDVAEKCDGWVCEPLPPKQFLNMLNVKKHRRNADGVDQEDADIATVPTRDTRSVVQLEIELSVIIKGFIL